MLVVFVGPRLVIFSRSNRIGMRLWWIDVRNTLQSIIKLITRCDYHDSKSNYSRLFCLSLLFIYSFLFMRHWNPTITARIRWKKRKQLDMNHILMTATRSNYTYYCCFVWIMISTCRLEMSVDKWFVWKCGGINWFVHSTKWIDGSKPVRQTDSRSYGRKSIQSRFVWISMNFFVHKKRIFRSKTRSQAVSSNQRQKSQTQAAINSDILKFRAKQTR